MKALRQLLIAPPLPLRSVRRIHETSPDSRLVLWDGDPLFESMLAAAIAAASEVFTFDEWLDLPLFAQGKTAESDCTRAFSDFGSGLDHGTLRAAAAKAKLMGADAPPGNARPIVFCPSSDTHCRSFAPVAKLLSGSVFLNFKMHEPHERVTETLAALNLNAVQGGVGMLDKLRPAALVFANDWNRDSTALIDAGWARRIPSVCLQEGCLDFADPLGRMQRCNFPLLQGPEILKHLPHEAYFLTGNPRFDALRPQPLPAAPLAMLNANFTYGVHESARDAWAAGAARACEAAGIDFFISRHPRDAGAYPGCRVEASGALSVENHLRDASVLVTRFSTLIYEALLMGRPCIYYNPHGEDMGIFAELPASGLSLARNEEELVRALCNAHLQSPSTCEGALSLDDWLDRHCGPRDGKAAARVAAAVRCVARYYSPLPFAPLRRPLCIAGQRLHMRLPAPLRALYRHLRGLPAI